MEFWCFFRCSAMSGLWRPSDFRRATTPGFLWLGDCCECQLLLESRFFCSKYEAPGIWRNDASFPVKLHFLIYMLFGEACLSGFWLWASRATCEWGEPAHFAQGLGMFEEPATSADFQRRISSDRFQRCKTGHFFIFFYRVFVFLGVLKGLFLCFSIWWSIEVNKILNTKA